MRTPLLAGGAAIAVLSTLIACRDLTPPPRATPGAAPSFSVVPLWPDTVGICLGAGSPTGSYTFSWSIQNGQAGDIHDATSPTTATLAPGQCLVPWRREAPLPAGVTVTVIVTEVAAPAGAALDSVEVQDRYGDQVYLSATDTAQVDTLSGGALTFYHHVALGSLIHVPVLVAMLPLPGPDPSLASGDLRLTLDPNTPPNPCGPVGGLSGSGVSLCGLIRNPGGETFTRGLLMAGGLRFPFAETALPPNPCRQYVLQGAVALPVGLMTQLAADPSGVTLRFDSKEHPDGAIGGSPAGGATGNASIAGVGAGALAGRSVASAACVVRFGF